MCKRAQLLFIFTQPEKRKLFLLLFPQQLLKETFILRTKARLFLKARCYIYTHNVDVDDDDDDITTFFQ